MDADQVDCVMILQTTHHVLQLEEWLKQERIPHVLIPRPPGEQAGCGLAIRFKEIWEEQILQVLREYHVKPEGIYVYEDGRLSQRVYP